MESIPLLPPILIALIAAAMLFVEKRPPKHVAIVVGLMVASWVIYLFMFRGGMPTP